MDGRLGIPAADRAAGVHGVVIRFRIEGSLRFLSHAETLRVFQRACARARIPVKHSEGFNPHPRLSLPLPRSVGVQSDDELLVVRLESEPQEAAEACAARIHRSLQETLPQGIDILDVELVGSGSFHARTVDYVFRFHPERATEAAERVRERIQVVLASESWVVSRKLPGDPKVRRIDVRPFMESVQPVEQGVRVRCNVTAAGSIRIEEILLLLELKAEDLAGPVRRTAVQWVST